MGDGEGIEEAVKMEARTLTGRRGRLASRFKENEGDSRLVLPVDEQPIGLDVAFTDAFPLSGQRMVAIPLRRRNVLKQEIDEFLEKLQIQPSLFRSLNVLFELTGKK